MKSLPLSALLLLAACSGGADKAAGDAAGGDEAKPIAEVRTAVATQGSAAGDVAVIGATEASPGAQHSVTAPAEAIVAAVFAPTGTSISAGKPIVALKPSIASRLTAAKAASDITGAESAYQRAVRLKADGLGSQADVDTAAATLASARASGAYLGIRPGGLTLTAPVSGTVQGLTVKPGDQLAAGTSIASVVVRGDVRARFGIDPSLAPSVHVGQPVRISTLNGGAPATTTVVGVDPQIDPTTHFASVYTQVPDALGAEPGQPLKAVLTIGRATNVLVVPYAALLDEGGRSYVFVVRNGVAKSVDVVPGNSAGDSIQIVKGLNAGDRVVVEGGTGVEDGMKVHDAAAGQGK